MKILKLFFLLIFKYVIRKSNFRAIKTLLNVRLKIKITKKKTAPHHYIVKYRIGIKKKRIVLFLPRLRFIVKKKLQYGNAKYIINNYLCGFHH